VLHAVIFYLFMKSGSRQSYICQTSEDREAVVDIMERITARGNKMVEELLRLRKAQYAKGSVVVVGGGQRKG
jgi:hypothetical protein